MVDAPKYKFSRNDDVYFKALPKSAGSRPNARYLRRVDTLPNGRIACEIKHARKLWTVGEDELVPADEAERLVALKWQAELELAKANAPKQTKRTIAFTLGICVRTLNKRVELIELWLKPSTAK